MDLASKGDIALDQSQAHLAVEYYTRALLEIPRAPKYYIQRSTAYSRLKAEDGGPNSSAALRDAEIAVALALERGKRELILSAQFRRAVSLFQLERYGDASFLLQLLEKKTGVQNSPEDRGKQVQAAMSRSESASNDRLKMQVGVWVAKVNKKMEELVEGDEKASVSITEYPRTSPLTKAELEAELKGKTTAAGANKQQAATAVPAPTAEQISPLPEGSDSAGPSKPSTAPDKIRHEWYQSSDSVVVTLYAKGVPKDRVASELKDESVSTSWSGMYQLSRC